MKYTIIILALFITSIFNKTEQIETENEITVLATLIEKEGGSKVQVAAYKILKTLKGEVTNDTIIVGYYFYNDVENLPKTSVLNLEKYSGDSPIKDYYIFPNYNPKEGIEPTKFSKIAFDYWQNCETGEGECQPLTLTQTLKDKNWFVILPCGGTATSVTLSKEAGISTDDNVIQVINISAAECPPIFDLSNLEDGKYYAYMLSCGLGGQIEINLKTEKE